MDENPQSNSPGVGPDMSMPQADPAANKGPDSHRLPTLGQKVEKSESRDWEASYKGLNDWVAKEFAELRKTVEKLAAPKVEEVKPKVEEPKISDSKPDPGMSALDQAIQSKKAEQYRDLLLAEYTKPGAPAEGLPLDMFANNIQVIPPTIGPDGKLDDSGQRAVIENFAKALKGVQGATQQRTEDALLQGYVPGSSPGANPAQAKEQVYDEFKKIMAVMGTDEFENLGKVEQARMENRYYELLGDPIIEEMHGGQVKPVMNLDEMQRKLTDMSRKIQLLENRNPLGAKMR